MNASPLDLSSPIPLHFQVAQDLKQMIQRSALPLGEAIPPERELCDRYGVSRPTVRQAIHALVSEGLLERRRGVGTFVAAPKVDQSLSSIMGFSERIESQGRVPSTRVLEHAVLAASETGTDVSHHLAIAPTAPVLRLLRLRLVDGEPHLLQTVHLPLERLPGLDRIDLAGRSLYRVLRENYGLTVANLMETLEPILPRPREARILGITTRQPVMLITTTTRDNQGRPLEHTITLARGDRCRHYLEFHFSDQARRVLLQQTHLEVRATRDASHGVSR